jgi:hypothetical protein
VKIIAYCICAALAVVMVSCGDPGKVAALKAELKKCKELMGLDPAKATEDARRAKSTGDTRLLGVYGYNHELPGVSGNAMAMAKAHGVRMIEGTSDVIPSKHCRVLNTDARDYASRYNKAILQ